MCTDMERTSGCSKQKIKVNWKISVYRLAPFGDEAGASLFDCICVRVSGRIYETLTTMAISFGGSKKNLS